jgi:hypothetical protein
MMYFRATIKLAAARPHFMPNKLDRRPTRMYQWGLLLAGGPAASTHGAGYQGRRNDPTRGE